MSSSNAIGVFDSGLGGLSAVKEFLHILPNENIIYFGDTGRVPYGNRSRETITRYAEQDTRFLLENNVKMVVAACGTVSSVAGKILEEKLPVPYTGVVNPTAYAAAHKTKSGRIGVIGTSATINSHSYKTRLNFLNKDFQVFEQACPLFAPFVENGLIHKDDQIVRLMIKRYLSDLIENNIDTLILGCTHYPLLSDAISSVIGNDITLIDSGYETALYAQKVLTENDLLNDSNQKGVPKFFVSDTPDDFKNIAGLFLGRDMEHSVTQINIAHYWLTEGCMDNKDNINKDNKTNRYIISIIGEQCVDGQDDKVEVITEGNYMIKNGHYFIGYKEYDTENPQKYSNNLIKVENETVTISRKGEQSSHLILEKNRRHQCLYQTIAGDLTIGIFTKTLKNNLNETGGKLEVSYTLDFNSDLVSENRFTIEIKENNSEV